MVGIKIPDDKAYLGTSESACYFHVGNSGPYVMADVATLANIKIHNPYGRRRSSRDLSGTAERVGRLTQAPPPPHRHGAAQWRDGKGARGWGLGAGGWGFSRRKRWRW